MPKDFHCGQVLVWVLACARQQDPKPASCPRQRISTVGRCLLGSRLREFCPNQASAQRHPQLYLLTCKMGRERRAEGGGGRDKQQHASSTPAARKQQACSKRAASEQQARRKQASRSTTQAARGCWTAPPGLEPLLRRAFLTGIVVCKTPDACSRRAACSALCMKITNHPPQN